MGNDNLQGQDGNFDGGAMPMDQGQQDMPQQDMPQQDMPQQDMPQQDMQQGMPQGDMNNNQGWNGQQNNANMPPQGQQGYGPQQGFGQQQQAQQQPYPQQGGYAPQPVPGAKSATAAGLLGIFLGTWGVHNFYLGQKTQGIIHICLGGGGLLLAILMPILFVTTGTVGGLMTAMTVGPILAGLGWLAVSASGIWGLVEGIMCLTKSGKYGHDANGVPLV